jgi:hypothetical protein
MLITPVVEHARTFVLVIQHNTDNLDWYRTSCKLYNICGVTLRPGTIYCLTVLLSHHYAN